MLFAGCLGAGGLRLAAAAPSSGRRAAGFVIAGAGLALSAPTLLRRGRPARRRGRPRGRVSTVAILGYLGFLAGPALIGAVSSVTSLRGGFVFLCAVARTSWPLCAPTLRRVGRETGG